MTTTQHAERTAVDPNSVETSTDDPRVQADLRQNERQLQALLWLAELDDCFAAAA